MYFFSFSLCFDKSFLTLVCPFYTYSRVTCFTSKYVCLWVCICMYVCVCDCVPDADWWVNTPDDCGPRPDLYISKSVFKKLQKK